MANEKVLLIFDSIDFHLRNLFNLKNSVCPNYPSSYCLTSFTEPHCLCIKQEHLQNLPGITTFCSFQRHILLFHSIILKRTQRFLLLWFQSLPEKKKKTNPKSDLWTQEKHLKSPFGAKFCTILNKLLALSLFLFSIKFYGLYSLNDFQTFCCCFVFLIKEKILNVKCKSKILMGNERPYQFHFSGKKKKEEVGQKQCAIADNYM